ncbi:hypothetical protein AAXB25_04835 [Paenibacillus lautus]|uniref:hypothetical protein n=1 Tax=Paenibacillus lautus TaxID=1401 RepID=UPI003D2C08B6
MKKTIVLLLSIIIISNGIWSYMYFNSVVKSSNIEVQVYTLNGTGEKWNITDYKIIISPNKILRGHGNLAYKGDPTDIENSTYYKLEFKETNPYGEYETVYANVGSSKGGPVSILADLNDTGSIKSEYSYDELQKDRQNYESTTLTITWNDNEGELHSEIINLSINNDMHI